MKWIIAESNKSRQIPSLSFLSLSTPRRGKRVFFSEEAIMKKILLEFTLLILVGCNYSLQKNLAASSGGKAIEKLPSGTIPGYQVINTGIIAPKCLECHSGPGGNAGGLNLETYNNVKESLASIRDEVASGRMPKNRERLSAKEQEVLLAWIDTGGPQLGTDPTTNLPTPTPPPTTDPSPNPGDVMPDPDKIDYQLVNTKVITPRCITCHSVKGGDKGGVNLESYENVLDEIETIKDEVKTGSMPRPKTRPLTDFQKKLFLTWIEKGAPKNVPQN